MKIFRIEYGYFPSSPQGSIIIAESKEKALEIAGISINTDGEAYKEVQDEPRNHNESNYEYYEYKITELSPHDEFIYTGYNCC